MKKEYTEEQMRLNREAAYHDSRYYTDSDPRAKADKFYAITKSSMDRYHELIYGASHNKMVLEYGCGTGSCAFNIARLGSNVTGIDISELSIELAIKRSVELGVLQNSQFLLMNAENLEFADSTFDLVCGSGILHHLDLVRGYGEITRVLKPGGMAVFFEPLGHNPLINWYRRRTPKMRTIDEHPLLLDDIRLAERYFSTVRADYFHFFSLASIPFISTPIFDLVYAVTEKMDRIALPHFSPLDRLAWICVLELKK